MKELKEFQKAFDSFSAVMRTSDPNKYDGARHDAYERLDGEWIHLRQEWRRDGDLDIELIYIFNGLLYSWMDRWMWLFLPGCLGDGEGPHFHLPRWSTIGDEERFVRLRFRQLAVTSRMRVSDGDSRKEVDGEDSTESKEA